MENVEFKARLGDYEAALAAARELGADDRGLMLQEDTYFNAPSGRLKMRRIDGAEAGELIAYDRPDAAQARMCEYDVVRLSEAQAVTAALSRALGVRTVVRKTRRLLLWKNVRIHLDRVEGFGDFLEFEAVLGPGAGAAEASRDLAFLSGKFGINPHDILSESYQELVERASGARRP